MINLKVFEGAVVMSIWFASSLTLHWSKMDAGVLKSKHDFSARNPHDFGPQLRLAVLTPSVNLHYFNVAQALL